MRPTDVRIRDVAYSFEDFAYRTPLKFGGVPVSQVTLLNVTMVVETAAGKSAAGYGSMPLGNVWAYPSKELAYDDTLRAMRELALPISLIYARAKVAGHPIEITHELEADFFAVAGAIPKLATLVVASPFDAALHDAYGKVHGLNCYRTYDAPFFDRDLGDYLGKEFSGE